MITIRREYEFSAAHRIPGHPKCGRLHGHNYTVIVEVTAPHLDPQGFITDFSNVDRFIKPLINQMDHRYLLADNPLEDVPFVRKLDDEELFLVPRETTSAENLADFLLNHLNLQPQQEWSQLTFTRVTVQETRRNSAVATWEN